MFDLRNRLDHRPGRSQASRAVYFYRILGRMSSNDQEVFNTLERAVSGDLNDTQSIATRVLADLMRYGNSLRVLAEPSDATRNVVFGGLIVSPSGVDVSVAPGVLGQNSAILAPVPGPLDSTYRLARNDVPTVVPMPAPGGTTFYLIEAQMVQVITSSQLRDIYNPGLGVFAPALVTKQIQHQIQFQVLAGTLDAPAPSGGDWVPIAIVRRPPGGPAVLASDIIDVRPLAEWGRERPTKPAVLIDRAAVLIGAGAATNRVQVFSQIDGPGGLRTFELLNSTAFSEDMTSARFLSPGVVLLANTRFYLYLAPWSAHLNPRFDGGVNDTFEGILVLSDQAPTNSGRNPVPMNLPAPFGVTLAPAQTAYYVATLMRNNANTGWVPFQRSNGRVLFPITPTSAWSQAFSPPSGAFTPANHGISPRARHLLVHFSFVGAGAAAWKILSINDIASGVVLATDHVIDDGIMGNDALEVPYDGQATLNINIGGGNAGDALNVAVRGYQE